jgi:transcriptional regulator with XRE-family HTH domain
VVAKSKNDLTMDKFSIQNIQRLTSLTSELDYEKASLLFLKLRVLEKQDESYKPIRNHLRSLIKDYEQNNWADDKTVTDNQIKESDLAEALVQAENDFYQRRKMLIKSKLKEAGLTQSDLAKILGHRKGYMSELTNGLRPFSKEDLIIINRLFKIKLEDLIPTFIKQDKAFHIKKTLESLSHNKIKLTKGDFDLQMAWQ